MTSGCFVRDLIGRARIDHAGGEPIGDPKPLFDFAQRQNAAIRRQQAAVKFDHDRLAGSGRQTGQRQHRIVHGECGSIEIA